MSRDEDRGQRAGLGSVGQDGTWPEECGDLLVLEERRDDVRNTPATVWDTPATLSSPEHDGSGAARLAFRRGGIQRALFSRHYRPSDTSPIQSA